MTAEDVVGIIPMINSSSSSNRRIETGTAAQMAAVVAAAAGIVGYHPLRINEETARKEMGARVLRPMHPPLATLRVAVPAGAIGNLPTAAGEGGETVLVDQVVEEEEGVVVGIIGRGVAAGGEEDGGRKRKLKKILRLLR